MTGLASIVEESPVRQLQHGIPSVIAANVLTGVARLIADLGNDCFDRSLLDFLVEQASDVRMIFAVEVNNSAVGRLLIVETSDTAIFRRALSVTQEYANGVHRSHAIILRERSMPVGTLHFALQSANEFNGKTRAKYFDDYGAAQEFSIFSRDEHRTLYIGIASGEQGFDQAALATLAAVSGTLVSLVARHVALHDRRGINSNSSELRLSTLRSVLLSHEGMLTAREADVCAAILAGYGMEAIGQLLGISPFTGATHRKHAYAKLNISSHNELFWIVLSNLAH